MIECGYCWIKGNNIYDNNDGMILYDSYPHITENTVHEN